MSNTRDVIQSAQRRHVRYLPAQEGNSGVGQASVLWTAKVELSDNSGLFQSGLCQSQPVLLCKDSVKMQMKTG